MKNLVAENQIKFLLIEISIHMLYTAFTKNNIFEILFVPVWIPHGIQHIRRYFKASLRQVIVDSFCKIP